jgi:hypothetical protein
MARRIYVGKLRTPLAGGQTRKVFYSSSTPTESSHGGTFTYAIGPFRTLRAALIMAEYGEGNPHLTTVAAAEMLARRGLRHEAGTLLARRKARLNPSEARRVGEGDVVVDLAGKVFRVYNVSANWVTVIPEEGEISDKMMVPIGDFYEDFSLAPRKTRRKTRRNPDDPDDPDDPQNWDADTLRWEMSEGAVLSVSGSLGSMTSASFGGRYLGEYHTEREALAAVATAMKKSGFWPGLFYVNDHGNISLLAYRMSKSGRITSTKEIASWV